MAKAVKDAQGWVYQADAAGVYKFATAGKFVDADTRVEVAAGAAAASGSVEVTTSAQVTMDANSMTPTLVDGVYTFTKTEAIDGTVSGDADVTVSQPGWIDSIDSAAITGNVSGNAVATLTMSKASATVSGEGEASAPVLKTVAVEGEAKIGTITTTKPEQGPFVAASASIEDIAVTLAKTVITNGYLKNVNDITAEDFTINGTESATYYIPVTSGSIGVSEEDPGTDYIENTTAIIPSTEEKSGYLKLEEGYYPATKISLATMVPDDVNIGTTGHGAETILQGTTAYDKDGKKIVGTMTNSGEIGEISLTEQGEEYTLTTGYYEGGTIKVNVAEGTITNNVSEGIPVETIVAGKNIKIGKGYYDSDVYYKAQEAAELEDITGSLTVDATAGYVAPVLLTTAPSGPYVTFEGNGSMTAGNAFSGDSAPATKYLAIYNGEML